MNVNTDLLIVGAGPTGLMLANQLARRGVRPVIIDRHSGPAQQSRAMAVHARSLEIYAQMGIAQETLHRGTIGLGANMWAEGQRKARIPFEQIGKDLSPFPYVLMLGQDENELILGDRLRELGITVQWNTELVGLEQLPDRVLVTIRQPDGSTRRAQYAYVAGCDGSRSPVRELCGISFPGAAYESVFFVADTVATGDMVPAELNVYLWKRGFHLFFPMHGKHRWRVIGILPANLRDREDLTFDDVIPDIRHAAGVSLSFSDCLWFSTYRIHHRAANRFRDRRCFLLGDAAHVHSPMGGQGMNTGLQDAYNLAWKLALVARGEADAALLDSFEAERMPVAHTLLHSTDRAFTTVVSDSWLARVMRTRVIANVASLAMRRDRIKQLAFRTISQIGIQYRASPLSRSLAGLGGHGPQAGDRFPWLQLKFRNDGPVEDFFQRLDDRHFNLVVVGQPEPVQVARVVGDLMRTHTIPANPFNQRALSNAHIHGPCFYLLRPDGYIGLCGTHLDGTQVADYLADIHMRGEADAPRLRAVC